MKNILHFERMLAFALLFFGVLFLNFQSKAQSSTVSSIPAYQPNNGSGITTINFYNANAFPVMIDTIFAEGTSAASVAAYLWMNSTPVSAQPAGPIATDPNWTLVHSQVSTFPTANTQRPILSNISLVIPANTIVGLAVGGFAGTSTSSPGAGFMRYYTVPNATQKDTFTVAGVSMILGANVSYGNSSYTGSSYFHPRGFVGSIVFHEMSTLPCSGTPTANPIAGPDTICAQSAIQLSSTPLEGTGITYEWEQRLSGATSWAAIPGATSVNLALPNGISDATDFRLKVTCTNSNSSDYSNELTIETNKYTAPWTYDVESQPGTAGNNIVNGGCWIADPNYSASIFGWNVSGNGSTPSASTGPNAAHSGTKFFFTEGSSGMSTNEALLISPVVNVNSLIAPTLEFYYHMYGVDIVSMYIDATDDGGVTWTTLDSLIGQQQVNQSDPWLLRTVELLGFTGDVQVQFRSNKGSNYYADMAIDDISIIEGASICTGTPNANPVDAPDTVCAGTAFELLGNGPQTVSGLTYQWQESTAGAAVWSDVAGAASSDFIIAGGIFSPKDFRLIVTCTGSGLKDTSSVVSVVLNPNINECYCVPEGVTPSRYIYDFETTGSIQDIDNTQSGYSVGGYGDFTDTDTLAVAYGDAVTFSTLINGGPAGFRIWIDWNQDGVFDTVNEVAYQSNSSSSLHSGNFPIPNSAMTGVSRMRIASNWANGSGSVDPCATGFSFGEFEDYTFILYCDTPVINLISDTFLCAGDSIEIYSGNTDVGATYLWSTGETTDTITIDNIGTYFVTVTNLNGCSNTDSVHIGEGMIPVIHGIDTVKNANGSYTFTPDAEHANDYFWNFGDGGTSTDEVPTHTFTQVSNYTVRLIVSNDCGSDTALIDIAQTSGIEDVITGRDQLILYPNPASDKITLENKSNFKLESVSVYNILGQLMYSGDPEDNRIFLLNVHHYASGIYHIKVMLSNGKWIQRKFEILK